MSQTPWSCSCLWECVLECEVSHQFVCTCPRMSGVQADLGNMFYYVRSQRFVGYVPVVRSPIHLGGISGGRRLLICLIMYIYPHVRSLLYLDSYVQRSLNSCGYLPLDLRPLTCLLVNVPAHELSDLFVDLCCKISGLSSVSGVFLACEVSDLNVVACCGI